MQSLLRYCRYIAVLFLLTIVSYVQADDHNVYMVDEENSSVSFASIKKQYIVEAATLSKMVGSVSEQGVVNISIDLSSISFLIIYSVKIFKFCISDDHLRRGFLQLRDGLLRVPQVRLPQVLRPAQL